MDTASRHSLRLAHLARAEVITVVTTVLIAVALLLAAVVLIDGLLPLASEPVSAAPIRW